MKVLHVFHSLRPSGGEVMWQAAHRVLDQEGVETHMLSTGEEEGPYAEWMRKVGYTVHHIRHGKNAKYFDWGFCSRLYHLIRENGFDAILVHTEAWRFTTVLVAYCAGVRKLTTTLHSTYEMSFNRRIRRPIIMHIMKMLGCRIVAIGDSVLSCELQYHYRPELIWNWVDLSRFQSVGNGRSKMREQLGVAENCKVVLTVANCAVAKNHPFLFRVLKRLPHNYVLVHVGIENEQELHERELVRDLCLEDRVRFLGRRDDIPDLMGAADVFTMTSIREGLGVSSIEAAAAGLPAVVSNVGGLRDLARHFPLFVESVLDEDKFSVKIREACEMNAAMRQQLKAETLTIVANLFSMDLNVRRYISLWR